MADFFKLLAARLELFVDLDGLLSHLVVSLLRATDERKVRAGGDALFPVGIQANAQQRDLAFIFFAFAI